MSNETIDKQAALAKVIASVNKKYGEGMAVTSGSPNLQIKTINSGSILLNIATGGGIPRGRITEIYGEEATGKTTLALHAAKEIIQAGGLVAFIDAEQAFNEELAINLGIDVSKMVITQPDYGEQGLEIAREYIASNLFDMIIIDSVPALIPKAIIEGEVEDQTMGVLARMMSKVCPILATECSKSNTAVVFINQLRDKIGGYVPMKVTSGGNALKYACSLRLEVKRKDKLTRDDKLIGNRVAVKIIKNKITSPGKQVEFNVMFDGDNKNFGVDNNEEIFTAGLESGVIIQGGGGNYTLPNGEKVRGKEKVMEALNADPKLMKVVKSAVEEAIKTGKKAVTVDASEVSE